MSNNTIFHQTNHQKSVSKIQQLQSVESECVSVNDWVNLAIRALEDPPEQDYAQELAGKAEMECQDPADYVTLATFVAQNLNDTDSAEELLEQAEEACFEPMEFAQVGQAYATLMGHSEKGIALVREAVDSASGSDLVTLSGYAHKAGDEQLASSLLSKATANFTQLEQFLEMATDLVNSDQHEAARGIFKSAERHLQSVADSVSLAATYSRLLDDQTQARTLLESAEMDCQFPADYTALAKGFMEVLNEPDRIDDLLEEATDIAMEGEEFLDVAFGYLDLKEDTNAALENFRQAVADISDRDKLQTIAKTAATRLDDSKFALECYEKTAEKITTPGDLVKLAVESWETLGNSAYTTGLFERAREKMANANDLVSLAESVTETLNDVNLVSSIYRNAGAQVDSFTGLERILASQRNTIEDASLTSELVERMKALATSSTELINTFEAAQPGSQDHDFLRSILTEAEDSAANPADLEAVIRAVEKFASDDRDWLTSLADKLARRQANQAKYAEIQAQQKKATSALEFLRLARRVIGELDDAAYARKLIDEGLAGSGEQNLDVSVWLFAIEIASLDLKDIELVRDIAKAASVSCTHFSSVYILVRKLNESLEEPHRTELTQQILSDWESQLSLATDSIKLAKAVVSLSGDAQWANEILDSICAQDLELLQWAELGELARQIGDIEKSNKFYLSAITKCENVSNLTQLMQRMRVGGAEEQQRKDVYREGRGRLSDILERLRWTEGILLNFSDADWATAEYNQLESEVSDDLMRTAFRASRRQHLDKRFY